MSSWLAQALCAETGVVDHVWFPGKGKSAQPTQRICLLCPVRQPCLEFAVADPTLRDGVWGGATPRMREHLRAVA